jgi:hypothetical protein
LKNLDKLIAVVALDFDHTVFDRAAATAAGLEFPGKMFEFGSGQRHSGDNRNTFAFAAGGFATDTDDAVTGENGFVLLTDALIDGPLTRRAHTAVVGGVDKSVLFIFFHGKYPLFRAVFLFEFDRGIIDF